MKMVNKEWIFITCLTIKPDRINWKPYFFYEQISYKVGFKPWQSIILKGSFIIWFLVCFSLGGGFSKTIILCVLYGEVERKSKLATPWATILFLNTYIFHHCIKRVAELFLICDVWWIEFRRNVKNLNRSEILTYLESGTYSNMV